MSPQAQVLQGRELVDARRDEHRPSGQGSSWRLSSCPPSRRSVTRSCRRVCNDLPETSGCAISCVEPTPAAVAHLQLAQLDQLPLRCSEVPQVGEGRQKPPWSATRGERNIAGATALPGPAEFCRHRAGTRGGDAGWRRPRRSFQAGGVVAVRPRVNRQISTRPDFTPPESYVDRTGEFSLHRTV